MSAGAGKTLSRDYKHVKRHTPGTPAFSGWMGLAVGLTIGLGVALAVHLHDRGQVPAAPEPNAEAKPASAKSAEEALVPAEGAEAEPNLTFYDMLPKQEVEVPKAVAKAAAPASALPTGDVVLQAGSFKQPAEAEKLQARLAQYGIDAKIQRYSLEDETWYRVRIGPLVTVEELEAVRAKLAEAEIEATPAARSPVDAPP